MALLIGQTNKVNSTIVSGRTKAKILENVTSLCADIQRLGANDSRIVGVVYNTLSWTAQDTLKQAVEDGYASSIEGVEL